MDTILSHFMGKEIELKIVLKSEAVVWSVLLIIEAFVIVVCNLFPIVQLAGRGHFLKRSCYLLMNLASADTVVGACAVWLPRWW